MENRNVVEKFQCNGWHALQNLVTMTQRDI